MLGAWARERRRQLGEDAVDLARPSPDADAMHKATGGPIDRAFEAECACACHEAAEEADHG